MDNIDAALNHFTSGDYLGTGNMTISRESYNDTMARRKQRNDEYVNKWARATEVMRNELVDKFEGLANEAAAAHTALWDWDVWASLLLYGAVGADPSKGLAEDKRLQIEQLVNKADQTLLDRVVDLEQQNLALRRVVQSHQRREVARIHQEQEAKAKAEAEAEDWQRPRVPNSLDFVSMTSTQAKQFIDQLENLIEAMVKKHNYKERGVHALALRSGEEVSRIKETMTKLITDTVYPPVQER